MESWWPRGEGGRGARWGIAKHDATDDTTLAMITSRLHGARGQQPHLGGVRWSHFLVCARLVGGALDDWVENCMLISSLKRCTTKPLH
jgi:hypothetical protein